jgi:hypothetical protein
MSHGKVGLSVRSQVRIGMRKEVAITSASVAVTSSLHRP